MFVILVSHWTRKWPFLWGPRLRSLAAIKLTDVNGSFWSFGIVACGRKLRLHDLEGWCNGLLIIFFPTASFRKQPRANATSSVHIYICTYTPYISIFIPFYLFLPGPAPGHAVRGFSQRIGDGVQCSNGFDVQWVDLWISQCRTWPQAHTTWTCMFLFKANHIKTYHEWWAVDQTSFMKHDSDESPYDELWELLTCQGEESWL